MKYRYLVTQKDLNAHGTLHGGILVKWVDEACGMEARMRSGHVCATRHVDMIDFRASACLGDIVEILPSESSIGNTSITYRVTVRNATGGLIATFGKLVFVAVDENHQPVKFVND